MQIKTTFKIENTWTIEKTCDGYHIESSSNYGQGSLFIFESLETIQETAK